MNTVIKLLLYLLVTLLLVSWLITVARSCNDQKQATRVETVQIEYEGKDAGELMEELETEADFAEELDQILDEEEEGELDYSQFTEKDKEAREKVEEKEKEKANVATSNRKEDPPPPARKVQSSSSGDYLVIAGSYIVPRNAKKHRDKLTDMGYRAEVVNFDLSEYHTVLAGRYDSYDSALRTASDLKNRGIDAYVKKRTF